MNEPEIIIIQSGSANRSQTETYSNLITSH